MFLSSIDGSNECDLGQGWSQGPERYLTTGRPHWKSFQMERIALGNRSIMVQVSGSKMNSMSQECYPKVYGLEGNILYLGLLWGYALQYHHLKKTKRMKLLLALASLLMTMTGILLGRPVEEVVLVVLPMGIQLGLALAWIAGAYDQLQVCIGNELNQQAMEKEKILGH
jgi:hypothetical protein